MTTSNVQAELLANLGFEYLTGLAVGKSAAKSVGTTAKFPHGTFERVNSATLHPLCGTALFCGV